MVFKLVHSSIKERIDYREIERSLYSGGYSHICFLPPPPPPFFFVLMLKIEPSHLFGSTHQDPRYPLRVEKIRLGGLFRDIPVQKQCISEGYEE